MPRLELRPDVFVGTSCKIKSKIVLYLFLLLLVCFETESLYAQKSKPNVIIINMDDMGYGDVEPYGLQGVRTPHFNQLAKESLRFTQFEVAQAVCTPSRAALLTGCYPNRVGMFGALLPWSDRALNPSEETIASLLKPLGYQTAIIGKWHLGNHAPYLPRSFGFDYYFGIPYSNDLWPFNHRGERVTDTADFYYRCPPLPLVEGEKTVSTINSLEEQSRLTGLFTQKAKDFLEKNKGNPFFLYLAHPMPHVPIAASAGFRGRSGAGLYGDVLTEIDWAIGEIMKTLKKEGLDGNTILVVTSDNGPWKSYGNHSGSSGGLREGKMTIWEGGTRVPFFVRWPGKITPGICSEMATNLDLLPTVAALCGAKLPAKKIDGMDMSSLLLQKTTISPRDLFYYYYNENSLRAVRYKNWKLVLPHTTVSYEQAMPGKDGAKGEWKTVKVEEALYDLFSDPGERMDVKAQYPEQVKALYQWVEEARKDLGDELTGRPGANRRAPAYIKLSQ